MGRRVRGRANWEEYEEEGQTGKKSRRKRKDELERRVGGRGRANWEED
jgi:hypothetical protein